MLRSLSDPGAPVDDILPSEVRDGVAPQSV
jgi:hypothetical protein